MYVLGLQLPDSFSSSLKKNLVHVHPMWISQDQHLTDLWSWAVNDTKLEAWAWESHCCQWDVVLFAEIVAWAVDAVVKQFSNCSLFELAENFFWVGIVGSVMKPQSNLVHLSWCCVSWLHAWLTSDLHWHSCFFSLFSFALICFHLFGFIIASSFLTKSSLLQISVCNLYFPFWRHALLG